MIRLTIIFIFICGGLVAQVPNTGGYLLTNSNNSVSIGTRVNTAPLTVANFETSFPAPQAGTIIHIVSDAVTNGRISSDTYNNTSISGPDYQGRRGRGTAATPLPPIADDILVAVGADGYGDDSFTGVSVGSMNIRADGTFSNVSKPTYISFTTTPSGSITQAERLRILPTGQLRLNGYGSGAFTGTPTRSLQVDASGNIIEGGLGGSAAWGSITGTLSDQSDLQTELNTKLATNGNGSSLTGLTKSQVGLANVDNTSDANKPVSAATQTALDGKLATNGNGSALTGLTKSQVGLANVDNTSDANKPVSTATQTALDAKQATLVSGTNIKTVNGTTLLGSGNLAISGAPTFINLAANFSSTSTTPAVVTGWNFAVTSGVTYRITVLADYQTAATTTGGILGISLTGATGSVRGWANGTIVNTAAASNLTIPIRATSGAGSTLTTTGVTAANSPHYIGLDITFTCTGSGTFNIVWGTEVNASAAQLNQNSSLIYQALN